MSELTWDKVNEREYFSGVDRGVLYLADGSGVVWNGITGVDENAGYGATLPLHFDGVKYHDLQQTAEPTFTLKAITYPDEFIEYEGFASSDHEMLLDNQAHLQFGLSYRVKTSEGYQIHLWYNLTATAEGQTSASETQTVNPNEFNWVISGIPYEIFGYLPTEHFIFDSRELSPVILAYIEAMLYGDFLTDAQIPLIEDLLAFAENTDPLTIVPQPDGISDLIAGGGDLDETEIDGVYRALRGTRLVETNVNGVYTLEV